VRISRYIRFRGPRSYNVITKIANEADPEVLSYVAYEGKLGKRYAAGL